MQLVEAHRGTLEHIFDLGPRVRMIYTIPLNELITTFHDQLKSVTSGFGSLEYEVTGYQVADLVKISLLVNHEIIEALGAIVPREQAEHIGRRIAAALKEVIPRQMFEIPIQAAIGGKIIARETVQAFRKDVTAKLYGGDATRRMKLLRKQARGKKRMKSVGKVTLPQEAFLAVLER
jgi:GTP-binding protein LepA